MNRRSRQLFVSLMVFTATAACAVLVAESWFQRERSHSGEFQRLVIGLGLGPAADGSRCGGAFDPRLCPGCEREGGPLLGGAWFCCHHTMSVFPIGRQNDSDDRGKGHDAEAR